MPGPGGNQNLEKDKDLPVVPLNPRVTHQGTGSGSYLGSF